MCCKWAQPRGDAAAPQEPARQLTARWASRWRHLPDPPPQPCSALHKLPCSGPATRGASGTSGASPPQPTDSWRHRRRQRCRGRCSACACRGSRQHAETTKMSAGFLVRAVFLQSEMAARLAAVQLPAPACLLTRRPPSPARSRLGGTHSSAGCTPMARSTRSASRCLPLVKVSCSACGGVALAPPGSLPGSPSPRRLPAGPSCCCCCCCCWGAS